MNKTIGAASAVLLLAGLVFGRTAGQTDPSVKPAGEPDRVTVQHILIAFKGSIPDEKVTRSQAEAKALAEQLFERAKKGEDFKTLVQKYTDDRYPGIYKMANFGLEPVQSPPSRREYARAKMVKGFGDVGFKLKAGEVGLAVYDPAASKYGWHIIKRID